jgi:hypothetical protein
MVRLKDDIDECACIRCQGVEYEVVHRSLAGALTWSGKLPVVRPSILLVFLAVAVVQLLAMLAPAELAFVALGTGVLGVFVGRGYIGVVGREALGGRQPSPVEALRVVFRRVPAFLGAVLVVLTILATSSLLVVLVLSPAATQLLEPAGVDAVTVEIATLFGLAGILVSVLIKSVFVPEACFIGGYGPVESFRVSWTITTVHRAKVALIVAGFAVLLGVGVLLDTHLADPASPVALTLQFGDTTVVLRSFGFSLAGGVRFVFDLAVTALYSGVFVHQYVNSVFER